jgi:hypothetical protein
MQTKVCSKCKLEKDVCEFHKHPTSKYGVRGVCKQCRLLEKEKNKLYREKNNETIKIKNKLWLENNPNYMKEYHKNYNIKNRDKINQKVKKWREKNLKEILPKLRKKRKEKYDNDLNFKLKHLLRSRINKIIKYNRNKSSIEILGCTINEFKKYIENNFKDGMTWDNYGYYGWHIDHIIPISLAKSDDELMKLCHFTNLQPLWGIENIKKSNKIIKN